MSKDVKLSPQVGAQYGSHFSALRCVWQNGAVTSVWDFQSKDRRFKYCLWHLFSAVVALFAVFAHIPNYTMSQQTFGWWAHLSGESVEFIILSTHTSLGSVNFYRIVDPSSHGETIVLVENSQTITTFLTVFTTPKVKVIKSKTCDLRHERHEIASVTNFALDCFCFCMAMRNG